MRETVFKDMFIGNIYEIYTDINLDRRCSFSILLQILIHNNIKTTINDLKNLLVEQYKILNYKTLPLKKLLIRQKHGIEYNIHKQKIDFDSESFNLWNFILSENYYITTLDIYTILTYYKIPHIFVTTTFMSIYNKLDTGGKKIYHNFFVGCINEKDDRYYFIKINSSHTRLKEYQLTNHKLLSLKDTYKISLSNLTNKNNITKNINYFISEKINIYKTYLDKYLI